MQRTLVVVHVSQQPIGPIIEDQTFLTLSLLIGRSEMLVTNYQSMQLNTPEKLKSICRNIAADSEF
jgi:hypothetical protein